MQYLQGVGLGTFRVIAGWLEGLKQPLLISESYLSLGTLSNIIDVISPGAKLRRPFWQLCSVLPWLLKRRGVLLLQKRTCIVKYGPL